MRKGSPWLKTLLVQCAFAAARKKDNYYKAQFNRLRGRHGAKKAICAVAASMLKAIYHMLKGGTEHQDLGANHFDRRSIEIKAKRCDPDRCIMLLATSGEFRPGSRAWRSGRPGDPTSLPQPFGPHQACAPPAAARHWRTDCLR
jgi:hypothetical protein